MDRRDWSAEAAARLLERRERGAYRTLQSGSTGVDFYSNDYLGLAQSDAFRARVLARLQQEEKQGLRLGAGASRLLGGNSDALETLEHRVACFHRAESALFFSSGYAANAALVSTLAREGDTIFYDRLVHASLHEGMKLSLARRLAFEHNNPDALAALSDQAHPQGNVWVLCESIYSMDGDVAPLAALAAVCQERGWNLIVDEAHAAGLVGEQGRGLVCALGLEDQVFARVVTYGKAFGTAGASILGSAVFRDYLINYCRAFIYSTGPMALQVLAVDEAYSAVVSADEERAQLLYLRNLLLELLRLSNSGHWQLPQELHAGQEFSGIVPVLCPGNEAVLRLSEYLLAQGYALKAVRSPTVARGAERLRCCLHAYNTEEDVRGLAAALHTYSG